MTHGLLFSNSLVMHHSFQMTPGLLFQKLINYASHPSSNDHGPFVSSHSKEHLLYCFIIYKSKHVQTIKKIFRWKYKNTLQGNYRFTIRSYFYYHTSGSFICLNSVVFNNLASFLNILIR
jgi:hypothetical protein